MAARLKHRGPDSQGVWSSPDGAIALGFRRLAIIDLSPAGDQPMHSSDRRYTLVFNGEIYNFATLRRELEAIGHHFRGRSDTEVILAAVVQWGVEAAVKRLQGMFACGLWDARERELWLFRDRLGIKPLYYGNIGGAFAFASELKAFAAIPGFAADTNPDALAQYFLAGYIPAPLSIYKGIHKLEPGHIHRSSATAPCSVARAYWSLEELVQRKPPTRIYSANDVEPAAAELEERLRSAVTRHMVADVPLGVFLSGGLDSSLVAAMMQEHSTRPVRTFSIGFEDEAYDEAPFAKRIAEFIGADHAEFYVRPSEAMAVIPELPEIYDEPFADSSQVPTLLVSRFARHSVTVALSGDGGDELFGGYLRYLYGQRIWNAIRWIPSSVRPLAAGLLKQIGDLSPSRLEVLARKVLKQDAERAGANRISKVASVLGALSPDEIYDRLCSLGPRSNAVLTNPSLIPRTPSQRPIPGFLKEAADRMSYFDLLTYLPDDILTKVDRASMAVSLETRLPLLDDDLVEFCVALPGRLKIRGGTTKFLLRKVLDKYVPRRLLQRPKAGFALPIAGWLGGPLRDWCESLLFKQNGIIDTKQVALLWQEHLEGRARHHSILWAVLMLNGWLDQQHTLAASATVLFD